MGNTEKSTFAQAWNFAISREGSIIVTGLVAAFVLATVLVDRRVEIARIKKWHRRNQVLKRRSATTPKIKKLTDVERQQLFDFQKEINTLHDRCCRGNTIDIEATIYEWEARVGKFLEEVFDEAHKSMVLDAPIVSANRRGILSRQNNLIGWTQVRSSQLNEIIKEQRNR